ncbi:MAG: gamma-glutamylcyclotransferase family protein [Dehalococcoidales bacterium]|nr:gamma-glutamylcyclotransferase family protein [Dehalococcoidales bacterium]
MDYFAYGSNLNKQQMKQRCPDAKPRFQAVLPNYKLIFTGWSREWKSGTASIKPVRGEKVAGAVYEISEKDLRRLDRYEDYPTTYDRINVLVIKEDGVASHAITYIKRRQSDETKPSAEYLAIIRQGYRDWTIE